ncbi:aldolase/citrate lyase family protein [beta proteobacterium MWH-UniP1]
MAKLLHPDSVLHENAGGAFHTGSAPACEHYAGDEKKLRKALALQDELQGAFDVTADLEDGAASGQEAQMAMLLAGILAEPRPTTYRVGCRVHPADHVAFEHDVRTLLSLKPAGLAYLTIPKVTGPEQLDSAAEFIRGEALLEGWPRPPDLQVLLEDEAGIHHAHAIAGHSMVRFIAFGQMDFTSSHHGAIPASAMKSPGQFDHPLMRRAKLEISAACHAFGKVPTHNPTTDYGSATQAFEDASRAKNEFGFLRMWSIHPNQVRQILSAFAPSQAEIDDATRILLAAQAADWGPIADQGLLHDRASYRYFWTLLKRARAAGGAIPAAAMQAFF